MSSITVTRTLLESLLEVADDKFQSPTTAFVKIDGRCIEVAVSIDRARDTFTFTVNNHSVPTKQ